MCLCLKHVRLLDFLFSDFLFYSFWVKVLGCVCMHMLLACVCILVVCVRIQIGCVYMPYVCTRILLPRNPNSSFVCFSFCFIYMFYLLFSLFCLSLSLYLSVLLCLFYFIPFMIIRILVCLNIP